MRILLIGASGLIGSEIAAALVGLPHQLTGLGRSLAPRDDMQWIRADLRDLTQAGDWTPLLANIDIVINASGVLQNGLGDSVTAVHEHAVYALLAACRSAGVGRLIQISAANAAPDANSDFLASKGRADAAILCSDISHVILRPGLVIGRNAYGGSEMLRLAAALPWQIEPSHTGTIQCTAMNDLVAAVLACLDLRHTGSFDLVTAESLTLGEVIGLHRAWLGLPRARTLRLPVALLSPISTIADYLGWFGWRSPLRRNAMLALTQGITGDVTQSLSLLNRPAQSLRETLAKMPSGKADRWHARLAILLPLALMTLFMFWMSSGVIGLIQIDRASALLIAAQIPDPIARSLVIGGAVADMMLAIALIWRSYARTALLGTIALTLGYLIGATFIRPDLWIDPLAPLIKTVPAMFLSAICYALLDRR